MDKKHIRKLRGMRISKAVQIALRRKPLCSICKTVRLLTTTAQRANRCARCARLGDRVMHIDDLRRLQICHSPRLPLKIRYRSKDGGVAYREWVGIGWIEIDRCRDTVEILGLHSERRTT